MKKLGKEEFKLLFEMHFDPIRRYLYYRCGDEELASDVAQDLFTRVWEKQMNINPVNDKPLLYKMASDMIITKFRRRNVEMNFAKSVKISGKIEDTDYNIQYTDLAKRYSNALEKMGDKQRVTFLLSRNEDLKYTEIADRLGISVKAVEKRIGGAIEVLKRELNIN